MSTLQRLRMSYDEWWALPEKPKAEWVDGEVVVSPPAAFRHGEVAGNVLVLLRASLPSLVTVHEVGVQLPRNRVRIPDVCVVDHRPDGTLVTNPPVVVVEVLSPSTRGEDMLRKTTDYRLGGISQYWLVDPDAREITVLGNAGDDWEVLLRVDREHPVGEVEVVDHGVVRLDLDALLIR